MPLTPPAGETITITRRKALRVPDRPIVPYVEGDGTGRDIWRASQRVFDAAVEKAFGGKRKIAWFEVLAGEKAFNQTKEWMPAETLDAFRKYLVGIKGPLSTPVGGGIRSLNVALRQELDLYVCLRPVRYFKGVPSPVKRPEDVDMVLFRENTEDIYAGVEWAAGTPEVQKVIALAPDGDEGQEDPLPGDERHRDQAHLAGRGRSAWCARPSSNALEAKRKSLTLVHKGNIMKFTEGAFRDWGYALATREFRDQVVTERESWILGNKEKDAAPERRGQRPRHRARLRPHDRRPEGQACARRSRRPSPCCPRTATASGSRSSSSATPSPTSSLQQVLTRPKDFDVIATPNLNGDYLSDALAAQVGRHRHRARRQHQLRDRPRHLRGHARHRAQIRRPRQGEPRLGDPLRLHDAAATWDGARPPRASSPRWRRRSARSA